MRLVPDTTEEREIFRGVQAASQAFGNEQVRNGTLTQSSFLEECPIAIARSSNASRLMILVMAR